MEDVHVVPEMPETDLAVAAVMVAELEDYIVEDELYRTIQVRLPGRGDVLIKMTGGDLLTRLYRLSAEHARLSSQQQEQLQALDGEARRIINSLKTRFHQRLQREVKSRLDSLRWYIDEAYDDAARARGNYPFEMRNRQRIEEILKELGSDIPQSLSTELAAVDSRLRALRMGPNFVWDPSLESIFPRKPYWYLYAGA